MVSVGKFQSYIVVLRLHPLTNSIPPNCLTSIPFHLVINPWWWSCCWNVANALDNHDYCDVHLHRVTSTQLLSRCVISQIAWLSVSLKSFVLTKLVNPPISIHSVHRVLLLNIRFRSFQLGSTLRELRVLYASNARYSFFDIPLFCWIWNPSLTADALLLTFPPARPFYAHFWGWAIPRCKQHYRQIEGKWMNSLNLHVRSRHFLPIPLIRSEYHSWPGSLLHYTCLTHVPHSPSVLSYVPLWHYGIQQGLPFQKVQHKISTLDAQPSSPTQASLIVLVTGLFETSRTCRTKRIQPADAISPCSHSFWRIFRTTRSWWFTKSTFIQSSIPTCSWRRFLLCLQRCLPTCLRLGGYI